MEPKIKIAPGLIPITDIYDDGDIPHEDLPQDTHIQPPDIAKPDVIDPVEPLPESTRPRRDGPGGD